MKKIILIAMFALMGCQGMENKDIIDQRQLCIDAGMKPEMIINGLGYVVKVQCVEAQ